MQTRQHTPEQIIKILEQAAKGEHSISAVCREHGIAENTFARTGTRLAQGLWRDVHQRSPPPQRAGEREHSLEALVG